MREKFKSSGDILLYNTLCEWVRTDGVKFKKMLNETAHNLIKKSKIKNHSKIHFCNFNLSVNGSLIFLSIMAECNTPREIINQAWEFFHADILRSFSDFMAVKKIEGRFVFKQFRENVLCDVYEYFITWSTELE